MNPYASFLPFPPPHSPSLFRLDLESVIRCFFSFLVLTVSTFLPEGMLPDFDLPPCPVFEGGFTPWESQEFVSLFQTPVKQENSGSDEPNRAVSAEDERKRRRMISNRESARRSRMRKQKHLEDLRDQLNRLRVENGEITTRLGIITRNCHLIRRDNDRLKSESVLLRQRLSDISRILLYRQLQQFSSPSLCPSTNRPLNLNYNNGLHLIP